MAVHYMSTGIDFQDFSHASGAANELLDDYEEGTWTPSCLSFSGSINNNSGHYTAIGKLVEGAWTFNVSSGANDNSHWFLSSLPFNDEGSGFDRFGSYITRMGNQSQITGQGEFFIHKQNNNAHLVGYGIEGDMSYNRAGMENTNQNMGGIFTYFKAT